MASHPRTQLPHPRQLSRWGERSVVVLIGIQSGIDGVKPIYYGTMKVCDPPHFLTSMNDGAVFISGIADRCHIGSHVDNLSYLDPHHTRATVPCDRLRRRGLRNVSVSVDPD